MTRMQAVAGVMAMAMALGVGFGGVHLVAAPQDAKAATQQAPINLNAATAADLEKLPGVGPAMATKILEYRQKNGGFKKIEDLMNIQGIGEKNFLRLKPLVTVAPARNS